MVFKSTVLIAECPVPEMLCDDGVRPGVVARDLDESRRGVERGYRRCAGVCCCAGGGVDGARERLGEDAPSAADVEVLERVLCGSRVFPGVVGRGGSWGGSLREAGLDEFVSEGIHQVQDARGTLRIPPAAG